MLETVYVIDPHGSLIVRDKIYQDTLTNEKSSTHVDISDKDYENEYIPLSEYSNKSHWTDLILISENVNFIEEVNSTIKVNILPEDVANSFMLIKVKGID